MGGQEPISPGRRLIPGILLLMVLAVAAALRWRLTQPPRGDKESARPEAAQPAPLHARTELGIDGMDCLLCAAGLQNQLRALPGVSRAEVSYQDKRAVIEFEPARMDRAQLEKTIRAAGFEIAGDLPRP